MADAPRPYSATELLACVNRELSQRRHVYPRRVAAEKMTKAMADREIRMMEQIARHFEELASKERLL